MPFPLSSYDGETSIATIYSDHEHAAILFCGKCSINDYHKIELAIRKAERVAYKAALGTLAEFIATQ